MIFVATPADLAANVGGLAVPGVFIRCTHAVSSSATTTGQPSKCVWSRLQLPYRKVEIYSPYIAILQSQIIAKHEARHTLEEI